MDTLKLSLACVVCVATFQATANEHMGMKNFSWEVESGDEIKKLWQIPLNDANPETSVDSSKDVIKKEAISSCLSDEELLKITELYVDINKQRRDLAKIQQAVEIYKHNVERRKK